MLINIHIELANDARPDEIAAALTLVSRRAEPYVIALGRPLRVDESINLFDAMGGSLSSIIDCSINRSE
jgi:hypothetical protein